MNKTDEEYREDYQEHNRRYFEDVDEVYKRQRQEEDQYYMELIEQFDQIKKMENNLCEEDLVDRNLKNKIGDKLKKYDKPAKLNI